MEKLKQRKRPAVKSAGIKVKDSPAKNYISDNPTIDNQHVSRLDSFGITLNAHTAKQAVLLSEIIGKPVSKRKRRV